MSPRHQDLGRWTFEYNVLPNQSTNSDEYREIKEAIHKVERKKDGRPDERKNCEGRKNWRGRGNPSVAPVLDEALNYEEEVRSALD